MRQAQPGSMNGNNVGGARDGHLQDLLPMIQNHAYIDAPPSESGGSEGA